MKKIYISEEKIIKIIYLISVFAASVPYMLQQIRPVFSLISVVYKPFFVLSIFIFFYKKLYKDKIATVWALLFVWMNIITYINSYSFMSRTSASIFLTALVGSCFMIKFDKMFYLKSLTYYYSALLLLNTLLWREGGSFINSNGQISFFIGTKTSITYFQITAFVFAFVYFKVEENKKKGLFVLLVPTISVIVYDVLQSISTSKICLVTFWGLVFLDIFFKSLSKIILKVSFWITIIVNIAIIFFKVQYAFEYFLVDILEEDVTLDGREYIWDVVLANIANHPILGHGLNSEVVFSVGATTSYNTSAHNQLLSWVFLYGIVGLIMFLVFCGFIINKYKVSDIRGKITRIAFITLSAMWISEQWYSYTMFIQMTVLLVNLHLYDIKDNENIFMRYLYFGKEKSRITDISSHN